MQQDVGKRQIVNTDDVEQTYMRMHIYIYTHTHTYNITYSYFVACDKLLGDGVWVQDQPAIAQRSQI